jgi:hypothetical protein
LTLLLFEICRHDYLSGEPYKANKHNEVNHYQNFDDLAPHGACPICPINSQAGSAGEGVCLTKVWHAVTAQLASATAAAAAAAIAAAAVAAAAGASTVCTMQPQFCCPAPFTGILVGNKAQTMDGCRSNADAGHQQHILEAAGSSLLRKQLLHMRSQHLHFGSIPCLPEPAARQYKESCCL